MTHICVIPNCPKVWVKMWKIGSQSLQQMPDVTIEYYVKLCHFHRPEDIPPGPTINVISKLVRQ